MDVSDDSASDDDRTSDEEEGESADEDDDNVESEVDENDELESGEDDDASGSDESDSDENDSDENDSEEEEDGNDDGDYNYADSDDNDDNRLDINNVESADTKTSKKEKTKTKSTKVVSNSDSSSSDENSERTPKCPICLHRLSNRMVASPSSGCTHTFCLDCLREWSRNVNTCPIDRSEFDHIILKASIHGKEVSREKVVKEKKRNNEEDQAPDLAVFEDQTLCEVCGSGDREDTLLLCDACDLGYHLECCVPSLDGVPRGRWYCSTCANAGLVSDYIRRQRRREAASLAIGSDDDDESEVLPRTIEMERVRRAVRQQRDEEHRSIASASSPKKRKTKKKRKTVKRKVAKKQKTGTKKTTTTRKKGSKTTTTKKKGTKKTTTKSKTKRKTKGKKGKKGKGKKGKKGKKRRKGGNEKDEHSEKINNTTIGPGLSIYGDVNDLDFFEDDEPFVNPVPSTSKRVDPEKPEPVNLLADIMACQTSFLTTSLKKSATAKMKEVYTKPEMKSEETKAISTSISRGILHQKMLKEKEAAKRKMKSEETVESEKPKSGIKIRSFATDPSLKSLLKDPKTKDEPSSSRKGVRFSDVNDYNEPPPPPKTSFAPETSFKSSFKIPKKIDLKLAGSGGLSSFKIPLKRKSQDLPKPCEESSSTLSDGSSSSGLSNGIKPEKIPKLDQPPELPKAKPIKFENDSDSKTSSDVKEEMRKLRLAHFAKLGFKDDSSSDHQPVSRDNQKPVLENKLSNPSHNNSDSKETNPDIKQENVELNNKSTARIIIQSEKTPLPKPTDEVKVKREFSTPTIKSEHNSTSFSSNSERKRKHEDGLKGIVNGKERKLEDGVKVILNGKEIKIARRLDSSPQTNGVKEIKQEKGITVQPDSSLLNKNKYPDNILIKQEKQTNNFHLHKEIKKEVESYEKDKSLNHISNNLQSGLKSVTNKPQQNGVKIDETKSSSQNISSAGSKLIKQESPEKVSSPDIKKEVHDFVANMVKEFLKPFYAKGSIDKESYKTIMKKTVPKILSHTSNKTASVNKEKVKKLVESYVHKYSRKT